MSILLTHTLRRPITLSGLNPAARPASNRHKPEKPPQNSAKFSSSNPKKTPKTTPKSVKIPPSNLTISSKTLEILSDQARGKKFHADNPFGPRLDQIEQNRTRPNTLDANSLQNTGNSTAERQKRRPPEHRLPPSPSRRPRHADNFLTPRFSST